MAVAPPVTWGRARGRPAKRWQLHQREAGFTLTAEDRAVEYRGEEVERLSVKRGWFRTSLLVAGSPTLRFHGLDREAASTLEAALERTLVRHRVAALIATATGWQARVQSVATTALEQGRWISRETREELEAARPAEDVRDVLADARERFPSLLTTAERDAVASLEIDLEAWADEANERVLAGEVERHAEFFRQVESRPLTDEQVRAVVCFDNRVQVVAAAGSGKTSVMVARAAYAVMRGFVRPEGILLLAFNKAAASELQARVTARLTALGLPSQGVRATTFHAFGLGVIGQATGRKPRPADWLDNGKDIAAVTRIVDELRDRSPSFAYRWDLFRLLYARASESPDGGVPDAYDAASRCRGFRTAQGEVVKSEGERIIADWLFLNGVPYEYEKPYVHDVADAEHGQYRPDFFYPTAEVWHEHWALDARGEPPASFSGYAESMRWKKELHRTMKTPLVETTWAEIIDHSGLERLADDLRSHGIELDWNPDRTAPGLRPVPHEELARLVRSFMTHVKSNALSRDDLAARVATRSSAASAPRSRLFLELYWDIHGAWDERLRAEGCVDFEDMLVTAADHLEQGRAEQAYELVLVDEFQDASRARARMVRALVQAPGRSLLAVGDDWQSINRFAGADVAVMTDFAEWFGDGPVLRLQTTFRCPQTLCDAASEFVSRNPRQLRKTVTSAQASPGPLVRLVRVAGTRATAAAVARELHRIAGTAEGGAPLRVDVLGRYNVSRDAVPDDVPPGVQVTFRTVHRSKGLEADHVVLPYLNRGSRGFPSSVQDDPLLDLAMPAPDAYPYAEERRLFYVALTRARREVTIVAVAGYESPFVLELVQAGHVEVADGGDLPPLEVCGCGHGTLVPRSGKYGDFFGCSTFPACDGKRRGPSHPFGRRLRRTGPARRGAASG